MSTCSTHNIVKLCFGFDWRFLLCFHSFYLQLKNVEQCVQAMVNIVESDSNRLAYYETINFQSKREAHESFMLLLFEWSKSFLRAFYFLCLTQLVFR